MPNESLKFFLLFRLSLEDSSQRIHRFPKWGMAGNFIFHTYHLGCLMPPFFKPRRPFRHPFGTILAPWGHLGAPWERQEGQVGGRRWIFICLARK